MKTLKYLTFLLIISCAHNHDHHSHSNLPSDFWESTAHYGKSYFKIMRVERQGRTISSKKFDYNKMRKKICLDVLVQNFRFKVGFNRNKPLMKITHISKWDNMLWKAFQDEYKRPGGNPRKQYFMYLKKKVEKELEGIGRPYFNRCKSAVDTVWNKKCKKKLKSGRFGYIYAETCMEHSNRDILAQGVFSPSGKTKGKNEKKSPKQQKEWLKKEFCSDLLLTNALVGISLKHMKRKVPRLTRMPNYDRKLYSLLKNAATMNNAQIIEMKDKTKKRIKMDLGKGASPYYNRCSKLITEDFFTQCINRGPNFLQAQCIYGVAQRKKIPYTLFPEMTKALESALGK